MGKAVAVFFLIIRKPGPALNPKLVLVSVFVNRTGDTKLDTLGRMIAYQIEQGLSQTGIAEVVPTVSVLESSRLIKAGSGVPEAQDELRALAERSGAGTLVSGAYYLIDGELQFHAEITDVVHRRPIQKLEPFKGSLGERDGLMTELRRRVLGALAAHFAPIMGEYVPKLRRPPLYEAFQEFLMGLDLFGVDYEQTERHFARALELDPTFVQAKLYTSVAYQNQGR